jgi:hypothetical protein
LNGGLALIPYNREGRRIRGVVRLNIDHLKDPYNYTLYRTGIAVGDYPVDHHHGQYPGKVPAIEFPKIPSFNIPLGCLIPEKIDGLIVCEKGISVTNIVNGSTRLQPVVLLTGQAAGVLAAKSIKEKKRIRDVSVRSVQEELLKLKCYLMPFIDVKPDDPHWEAIQRVGATGILKGVGKPEGWANKMFFYPDSNVRGGEFVVGLGRYLTYTNMAGRLGWRDSLTISDVYRIIKRNLRPYCQTKELQLMKSVNELQKNWFNWGLFDFDPDRLITRREICIIVDNCLIIFNNKNLPVDFNGKLHFVYSKF